MSSDYAQRRPVRLAIVGCGAIAVEMHIPAARAVPDVELAALVDTDRERARNVAGQFHVPRHAQTVEEIAADVDAVVVATPPHVRPALAIRAFEHGLHVLCEKPLANSVEECESIVRASKSAQRVLAVAHMCRFYPVRQKAMALITEHGLGRIRTITASEGKPYSWESVTGYTVRRELVPGGVMINAGVHTLDCILWWLGNPTGVEYEDDSIGGLESNVRLRMTFENCVTADFRQSRTCRLPYEIRISAEYGELLFSTNSVSEYSLVRNGHVETCRCADSTFTHRDCEASQLKDFAESVRSGRPPKVSGEEATRVVSLIEQCYTRKQATPSPEVCPQPGLTFGDSVEKASGMVPRFEAVSSFYRNKTVLVTGGTGFVGGRLAERLSLEQGARVRVLTRNWSKAVWAARYAVEIVRADLTAPETLREAVNGVDVIFHCASGPATRGGYRATNVEGTRHLVDVALEERVSRFVYVSSTAVHGTGWPNVLDESAEYRYTGRDYSDSKIDAEELLFRCRKEKRLPIAIVRPTYVWGARSQLFTVNPLRAMSNGSFSLVDAGLGSCHAVYVDNLVDAILLAGARNEAVGEAFIITDGEEDITWQEFYGHYMRLLRICAVPSVNSTSPTIRMGVRLNGFLSRALEKLSPNPAPLWRRALRRGCYTVKQTLSRRGVPQTVWDLNKYAWRGRIDISKARRRLGYNPRFSLVSGMAATERWVRDQLGPELGIENPTNECDALDRAAYRTIGTRTEPTRFAVPLRTSRADPGQKA